MRDLRKVRGQQGRVPRRMESPPHWGGTRGYEHKAGRFYVASCIDRRDMIVVATSSDSWDHVSVSRGDRVPHWAEMEQVKRTFFEDDETAMQLHVPVADHISTPPPVPAPVAVPGPGDTPAAGGVRGANRVSGPEEACEEMLRLNGFTGWVREHRFSDNRRWRFDFAFYEQKVALEVEGLTGGAGGRHQRVAGFVADAEKYLEATRLGWKVIRVPASWIVKGGRRVWHRPLLETLEQLL